MERGGCFVFGVENYFPVGIQEDWDSITQKINSTQVYFDESTVDDATVDELDFDKLTSLLPQLNKGEKWSSKNIAILMDSRILNGSKNPKITAAGWLCFAKSPREKNQFRNAYIEFQVFQGSARDLPIN